MGIVVRIFAPWLRPRRDGSHEAGKSSDGLLIDAGTTHAMSRLNVVPTPARINPTRSSLSANANVANLSYFSYTTGTSIMNAERNIPETDTKSANPERPAVAKGEGVG